jgi:hypothetical protein
MENEDTEYKSGDHNTFIEYVFTENPKPKKTIKLELEPPNHGNNINKHIFEQLLQIFTDGMKHLYGSDEGKVDIVSLDIDSIIKMKEYFESFGVELIFNMYNQENYVFKPYIYNNPELYNKSKKVRDFYYEIPINLEKEILIYRISFNI